MLIYSEFYQAINFNCNLIAAMYLYQSMMFAGLAHIMSMKTPKRFLALRLTPEMENKLVYLTTKVKFGNHKRYQDWFQRQV